MHIRCKLFVSHIRLHREHYRFRKRKTIIHSYFYYHIFIPPTEIFSVISVSIIYHSFIFYAIFFHKKFTKCIRHVHSSSCLCLICRFTPIKNGCQLRHPFTLILYLLFWFLLLRSFLHWFHREFLVHIFQSCEPENPHIIQMLYSVPWAPPFKSRFFINF